MHHVHAAKHKLPFDADDVRENESELDTDYPRLFASTPSAAGGSANELITDGLRALHFGVYPTMHRYFRVAMESAVGACRAYEAGLGVEIDFEIDGRSYSGSANEYGFDSGD